MASTRRDFIKRTVAGGAVVAAGIAGLEMSSRRSFSQEFTRVAYRELGSTGFKASEVGFGCMNMRNAELVHAAIDKGINYLDTANSYMNGENERVVGTVMKTKRDKVFLTTKIKYDNTGVDVKNMPGMVETSLKRLQTDHVDLLLLHIVDTRETVFREDIIKVFDDARKKGQTRFVGVSTHANQAEVLDAVVEGKFWQAALIGYSYISSPDVGEAIARARKAGIATIGMKNLLKLTQRPRPPIEDIRSDEQKDAGITNTQALIKWVLDNPYLDTTIPGMTAFEHLEENLALMSIPMKFGERMQLRRLGGALKGEICEGTSGCTGCRDQCPNGVQICEINRCLGYAGGYGDMRLAHENYSSLPKSSRIEVCAECDECLVKCVNGLDLTDSVRRARALFA